MAVDLGTAYISIVPTTKNMQGDITRALRGLDKVGSKAGKDLGDSISKSAMGGIGDKLTKGLSKSLKAGVIGVGVAAGGALAGALTKGFGRLQAIDQAEAKFRGLGKSAQEIKGIMGDVTAAVTDTAFSTADAADVAAMALAAGAKPGDELQRTLRLVGDSAAFAGKGFGELGPVFTEAMSMGKVTGETLAQMRDNSIPAIAALSEHLGVSTEEVQKLASAGKISFEDFAASMENYIGGQALASGDTFKGALDNMGSAMGKFGQMLLTPVFENAPTVFKAVDQAFDDLSASLEPVIASFAEWLAPQMENLANNVIPAVVDGVMGFVEGLISMGEWVQNNATWLMPLATSIGVLVAGYQALALQQTIMAAGGFLKWLQSLTMVQTLQTTVTKAGAAAQAAFNLVMNANPIMLVVTAVAALVAGLVVFFTKTETGRALWASFTNFLRTAWETVSLAVKRKIVDLQVQFGIWQARVQQAVHAVKVAFTQFKDGAVNAVTSVIAKFRNLPSAIKSAFAGAGSWLVSAGKSIIDGLAQGVRNAAGAVGNAIREVIPDNLRRFVPGLHFGGLVGFARGGVLPRIPGISDSQRDPILGVNGQGVPVARVEPGEFVVNRESTRKYGKLLAAINAGALDSRKGDWGLPGYANGGIVSAKQLLAFARGQNVNGKQAPASLEGYPYTWGGGLLGNWGDCSGAMSGLAAFVVGMALAGRKFATMNEGQVLAQMGFSRGTSSGKNAFEIGFFNGGPWGGHTSGTIYDATGQATNVEMGGGRGNGQIGGAAAGSRHSQYTDRYWIGLKSAAGAITDIVSTSVDGMTVKTDDGVQLDQIDWGTASNLASEWEKDKKRDKQLRRWIGGVYDTGGILPAGRAAVNLSGKPEVIINNSQLGAISKLANNVGALVQKFGMEELAEQFATKLEEKDAFGKAMLADALEGDSIKAYLGGLDMSEGVGLADKVGKLIGIDGIQSTFGGVASAWTDLEDAAIGQVDAADAVKQAEANLVKARRDGDKETIAAAESELEQAKGVAAGAAAAIGQAQVAMAIEVVSAIIGLVKGMVEWIDSKIQDVFGAQVKAWSAISDAFGSIGKLAETVANLRHEVAALTVDWAMSLIELANAQRELRFVQHDGVVAQLEGAVDVAEAQAAFDAQRQADMRAAALAYDDLSVAYDAFRWHAAGATQQLTDEMVAWSDKSHELFNELLAAQVGQQILEKQAKLDNLTATWKVTQAGLDLKDVTSELGVAAAQLAAASGSAFGLNQKQATVGQRYADLVAEKAKLQADQASVGTWINPVNWFTSMPANQRRIRQIDAQIAEIEAMDEFKQLDPAVKKEVDKISSAAGWMGFFGQGDRVAQLVENSALGDATRALDEIDFKKQLIDIDATDDERRRKIERGLAELEYRAEADPLEAAIRGLESEKASYETMAKYWGTTNEDVRDALLRLADAQEQGSRIVQLSGDTYSREGVEKMLNELGIRVEKLENPKPDAARVIDSRRGLAGLFAGSLSRR